MDVLVNFSDLVNKDRKDLSSWKAACSALNNMMRIYPECFSTVGESFAPLTVHAQVGSIEGVDQKKLETFLGKFLLVLDNEVRIEKVDFSGEHRFIEAGQNAAYCVDINGGLWNSKELRSEHNPELAQLTNYCLNMKDSFSREERRMLYHGMTLNSYPSYMASLDSLSHGLAVEFLVGGDRFSRFDISCALEGLKSSSESVLDVLEREVRKELEPALAERVISPEFLESEISAWIRCNDLKKDHLGRVFDQYAGSKQENVLRKKPKDVLKKMSASESRNKKKQHKI